MLIFCLLVIGGFALYVMTPAERGRLLGKVLPAVRGASETAIQLHAENDDFHDALRERTRWPVVTPALILLNVALFLRMLVADGAMSDPQTLVDWGGSFGPRTTNGEWWRLVTSTFVHTGLLHLLTDLAGLVVVGVLLERLVGHFACATVYLAAALFASLAGLSTDPMAVRVGSSGAIFGLYGLLAAAAIWGLFKRSLPISILAAKKMAPGAAVFLLYGLFTGALDARAMNGLATGFACGLALAWGIQERKPSTRRVAGALAMAVTMAVAFALPLRGFVDVKPALEEVVDFEARTATVYEKAVEQFRLGAIAAEALAHVIDRTIRPELHALSARLKNLEGVRAEHRSMVDRAEEYLRLRDESWRLRAEGLQTRNTLTLQKADRTERASLDVMEGFKPSVDR